MKNAINRTSATGGMTWRSRTYGPTKEVVMKNFQRIAVTVAFSFTCFSVPVLGAGKPELKQAGEKTVVETPSSGAVKGVGDSITVPGGKTGAGSGSLRGESVERPVGTPGRPDWVGSLADQVQALKQQFKKEHADLLKAYQEMLKQAKEVGKEERDTVREQFKVRRDELIARQKELREELKRRFQEFRAEHPDHLDMIDAAKERAREGVRQRRGHGGE